MLGFDSWSVCCLVLQLKFENYTNVQLGGWKNILPYQILKNIIANEKSFLVLHRQSFSSRTQIMHGRPAYTYIDEHTTHIKIKLMNNTINRDLKIMSLIISFCVCIFYRETNISIQLYYLIALNYLTYCSLIWT